MRYRSKDELGVVTTYAYNTANGEPLDTRQSLVTKVSGGLTKSDIIRVPLNIDAWRDPTPYLMSDRTVTYEEGFKDVQTVNTAPGIIDGTSVVHTEGPVTWVPVVQPSSPFNQPVITNDDFEKLSNKNLLKLRDSKINLAVNMAELGKTAEGVAVFASKLIKSYRAFRRGDFKTSLSSMGLTTRRKGKDAASTWLELQYGILPLMGDIKGGYDELTRKTRQHGQRVRVMSRMGQQTIVDETGIDFGDDNFSAALHFDIQANAQLVYWYEVDNPALLAASSVGLTNPAEVIWELTPWSFVLDWALPVGDYLGCLTAAQGFKFLGGSYTIINLQNNTRWLEPKPSFRSGQWNDISQSCSGRRVTAWKDMERSTISSYVPPRAYLPSFKSPVSVKHALNALALLRSVR